MIDMTSTKQIFRVVTLGNYVLEVPLSNLGHRSPVMSPEANSEIITLKLLENIDDS
jgi:hypothetical protein